jgi:hypothetical protein
MSGPRDDVVRSVPGSDRIVAILLAAGRSQRMGDRNKLLLDVGGRPMVRRVAETLLHSRVREVIAVLGYDRARVAAALAGLPLRIVVNEEYASGQMSSVRAGIAAITDDPGAIGNPPPGTAAKSVDMGDQGGMALGTWRSMRTRSTMPCWRCSA